MKPKRVKRCFKLEVADTGLIEIMDRVVDNKPGPTVFKFRLPCVDGYEFRKKFEALKEGNIVILEFVKGKGVEA